MARLVIIGLSSSVFAALLSAKKYSPQPEITVVGEKPFDLLHVCGLPYALEGELPLESLKHDIGAARMGVGLVRARATGIDTANRSVTVLAAGGEQKIPYDSLIIATGASPIIPPIPGVEGLLGKKVFTVYGLDDTASLDKAAAAGMRAVVIGAGPIGLEAAMALRKKGLEVTVLEAMGQAY